MCSMQTDAYYLPIVDEDDGSGGGDWSPGENEAHSYQ